MAENRIRELRKQRGVTLEALAARVGLDHSHLSRIERGERPLSLEQARAIARELETPLEVVVGQNGAAAPGGTALGAGGFAEDFAPFEDGEDWRLPPLLSHEYRFTVTSNVLAQMGILAGDVVYVDQDARLCAQPRPLQAVRVHWFDPDGDGQPHWLLRQFVPPSLLITNAADGANLRSIDMRHEDASVVGIITSVHRRVRGI